MSQKILGRDGKPAPLIRIAKAFEIIFNISFADIYDKRESLFRRKPYNLTKTLDMLRNLIIKEDRNLNSR